MKDYTITHPETGHQDTYDTLAEAKRMARKEDYTPVFIDEYDLEENDIITDYRIDNKGKRLIP